MHTRTLPHNRTIMRPCVYLRSQKRNGNINVKYILLGFATVEYEDTISCCAETPCKANSKHRTRIKREIIEPLNFHQDFSSYAKPKRQGPSISKKKVKVTLKVVLDPARTHLPMPVHSISLTKDVSLTGGAVRTTFIISHWGVSRRPSSLLYDFGSSLSFLWFEGEVNCSGKVSPFGLFPDLPGSGPSGRSRATCFSGWQETPTNRCRTRRLYTIDLVKD